MIYRYFLPLLFVGLIQGRLFAEPFSLDDEKENKKPTLTQEDKDCYFAIQKTIGEISNDHARLQDRLKKDRWEPFHFDLHSKTKGSIRAFEVYVSGLDRLREEKPKGIAIRTPFSSTPKTFNQIIHIPVYFQANQEWIQKQISRGMSNAFSIHKLSDVQELVLVAPSLIGKKSTRARAIFAMAAAIHYYYAFSNEPALRFQFLAFREEEAKDWQDALKKLNAMTGQNLNIPAVRPETLIISDESQQAAIHIFSALDKPSEGPLWPSLNTSAQELADLDQAFEAQLQFYFKLLDEQMAILQSNFRESGHPHKKNERLLLRKESDFDFSQWKPKGRTANREILEKSLFVLPTNDAESDWAYQILKTLEAPHLHVSKQKWGARLSKEYLTSEELSGIEQIIIFEMPDKQMEDLLERRGLQVILIDHHLYEGMDRRNPRSSLEQLMALLELPLDEIDLAIATNDRGYIPELLRLGLSLDQIRSLRLYDLWAQGKSLSDIHLYREYAKINIGDIQVEDGLYLLESMDGIKHAIYRDELALLSPDGVAQMISLSEDMIGFSGSPEITEALMNYDFQSLGYHPNHITRWTAGTSNLSRVFGFKPSQGLIDSHRSSARIPKHIREKVYQFVLEKVRLIGLTP